MTPRFTPSIRLSALADDSQSRDWLWALVFLMSLGCLFAPPLRAVERSTTALDRYVAAPDSSYNYRLADRVSGQGYTTFILEMTSQTWLTTNEVDRTLWKHWMTITRPDNV